MYDFALDSKMIRVPFAYDSGKFTREDNFPEIGKYPHFIDSPEHELVAFTALDFLRNLDGVLERDRDLNFVNLINLSHQMSHKYAHITSA